MWGMWIVVMGWMACGDSEAPMDEASPSARAKEKPAWLDNSRMGPKNLGNGRAGTTQTGRHPAAGQAEPPAELRCKPNNYTRNSYECFVKVPSGRFLMGAQSEDPAAPGYDAEAVPSEQPPHTVDVAGFWMMQREVPASLYRRCVQEGACSLAHLDESSSFTTYVATGKPQARAINGLDWEGARELCHWYGGRLPTEQEWEYAARGPESLRFPWGAEPACGYVDLSEGKEGHPAIRSEGDSMVSDTCDYGGVLWPNDMRGPSPFEVVGMAGNVWEWTADDFAPSPGGPPLPAHAVGRTLKIQRGGGWTSTDPVELRSASRLPMDPTAKMNDVGVRCVWGSQ